MSTPTAHTPTYLDQLPKELLTIIVDYVVVEADTPCARLTPADLLRSLHSAWPDAPYKTFTEPYMHRVIDFDGSAFGLKKIMDGFLLHPETRLWARVLRFSVYIYTPCKPSVVNSIKREFEWLAEACTNLGLKVEDTELPDIPDDDDVSDYSTAISSEWAWSYRRLKFLAQVLHKVTMIRYDTNSTWIWPFSTFYRQDLQTRALLAAVQSEDSNIITERTSRTLITPVPAALRAVKEYCMGKNQLHYVCKNLYDVLLPAFFLPNIRVIHCNQILCPLPYESLQRLGFHAPQPHTSPITTLYINSSAIPFGTLERFISLPKALAECSYRNCSGTGSGNSSLWDVGQLLSKYQSKSLEVLALDGIQSQEHMFGGSQDPLAMFFIPQEPIGSLRDFIKLRVIEAPFWSLICKNTNQSEIPNRPNGGRPSLSHVLPHSLEILKLTFDYYGSMWLPTIEAELMGMIEVKKEMYPRLAKVDLDIRNRAHKLILDWDSVYKGLTGSLGDLARQENVQLIIH